MDAVRCQGGDPSDPCGAVAVFWVDGDDIGWDAVPVWERVIPMCEACASNAHRGGFPNARPIDDPMIAGDLHPCERCGEWVADRRNATPGDLNSPLWCEACVSDASGGCSYCDAPITDEGPYCDDCLGNLYGRRPCVVCGVSVAGWPVSCPSCGSDAWTGGAA